MTSNSNLKDHAEGPPSSHDHQQTSTLTLTSDHFTLKRVEGSPGCFNDVIVFPYQDEQQQSVAAKCNFVFFGGDIQDYPDEMQKNPTSRRYSKWNLIDTGRLLAGRINGSSSSLSARANLLVVRADAFHLKCFANYSNFVQSTCFGVPLSGTDINDLSSKKTISRVNLVLEDNNKSSESSANKENNNHDHHSNSQPDKSKRSGSKEGQHEPQAEAGGVDLEDDPLRCWNHLKLLIASAIEQFNKSDNDDGRRRIDAKLPIVVCAFSKGCIVLNELCQELAWMRQNPPEDEEQEAAGQAAAAKRTDTVNFMKQIKDLVWLDGGHCGVSNAWIVSGQVVECIKENEIACYVYVTPYQMKSSKQWAVEEYKKFVELLKAKEARFQNEYYFQEKEDDYDIDVHFEILKQFDLVHIFGNK